MVATCSRPSMGTVLFAALGAASCNALWGVDDLSYTGAGGHGAGASSTTSSTGAGSVGGHGGETSTAGAGGAGGLAPGACVTCAADNPASALCVPQVNQCEQTVGCQPLAACMAQCPDLDAVCHGNCIEAHPTAAPAYHDAFECVGCNSTACATTCAELCDGGCSTGHDNCLDCINGPCALAACAAPAQACANDPECLDMAMCIEGCAGDTSCSSQCAGDHPTGAALFNAVLRCTLCTKPACWDICAAEQPNCAGYQAP